MTRFGHFGPKIKDIYHILSEGERVTFDSQNVGVTFSLKDVKGPGVFISWRKCLVKGQLIFT